MQYSNDKLSCKTLLQLFPPQLVEQWFLQETTTPKKRRKRRLAPFVLFLGITLYAARGLEHLQHAFSDALAFFEPSLPPKAISKGSITPARKRLPLGVLQRATDHVRSIAKQTPSQALLKHFKVRCIDGTTFSVADTPKNEVCYGRPKASRGKTGYPRLRAVLVMDAANHLFIDEAHGHYDIGETTLADRLLERAIGPDVLLEADRHYYSYERACRILAKGGHFLFRIKEWIKTPVVRELEDGSYVTVLLFPKMARRKKWKKRLFAKLAGLSTDELLAQGQEERKALTRRKRGVPYSLLIRVVQYDVIGEKGERVSVKLLCSPLEVEKLGASEAAEGYHLRWSEEVGIRELKWLREKYQIPHLPGKTPEMVEQDLSSLLLAHSVMRVNMLLAANEHGCDPRRLSLSGARAVLLRYLPRLPQVEKEQLPKWLGEMLAEIARHKNPPPQDRICPRAVKVKMSNFPTKSRCKKPPSTPSQRNIRLHVPSGAFP